MTPVFLDTVGLLALWDQRDQWCRAAAAAYLYLEATGRRIVTTSLVLYECGNAAARRPFRPAVDQLRQSLAALGGLIHPTAQDEDAAWAAYNRGEAGDAGIVDHLSFAVMRRLGLADAFTNDRHFAAAGFNLLF